MSSQRRLFEASDPSGEPSGDQTRRKDDLDEIFVERRVQESSKRQAGYAVIDRQQYEVIKRSSVRPNVASQKIENDEKRRRHDGRPREQRHCRTEFEMRTARLYCAMRRNEALWHLQRYRLREH